LGHPLARWFVTEAYRITDTGQLIAAAGKQLVAAGIPLYRLAYFQLTLPSGSSPASPIPGGAAMAARSARPRTV